jgi:predicted MFS family arabinose efflux permease
MLASALVGRLPQGMSSLAILLLVRGTTGSYGAAGAAVGTYALASAVVAPLQGRLVDRFGRLRVLTPTAIGQGVALAALVVGARGHADAVVLVLLSGLAGALVPPIAPTVRALMGEVFSAPAVRETAYALDSVAQELVWITGPLIVALIITVTSPADALLVGAVVCICGTLLFVHSPLARDRAVGDARHERIPALASLRLRALLGPIALTGMGLGAIEVGLPSLALHAGSLLLILAVAFTVPLIAARSIPAGIVGSLLAGLTIAPVFTCQYALVGRAVTPGSQTEAFTWVTAALVAGIAAGAAAGGAIIGSEGVGAPFVLSCLATSLAAVLATGLRSQVGQPA